ncbi:uncharacterized protein LOC119395901 [Rhipicephalus sanguineus]|uniref:uncharacterized protein LOC119395901 n=1 Tax=Rhipicephalus sanguineus TaxID=34632 RepID=UPI0020C4E7BD|nr:uncharacterized protein LOC119395901 [Rhipicephalus sanguineus]
MQKAFRGPFQTSPLLTLEDCLLLGQLVAGDQCPNLQYFMLMSQQDPTLLLAPQGPLHPEEVAMEDGSSFAELVSAPLVPLPLQSLAAEEREEMQEEFLNELRCIASVRTSSPSSDKLLAAAISQLRKIKTSSRADALLLAIKLAYAVDRRLGRQIKVQPTSLARRRPGLPRGSARMPAGHPQKAAGQQTAICCHKLSKNMQGNVPAAKSH